MKIAWFRVALMCCGTLTAMGAGLAEAHSPIRAGASGVALAIVGKTCVSKAGAKFSFGADGHYRYDGLWQSEGRYRIHDNSVVVTFDSGLRRAFAVSLQGRALYLEQTALSCT